jgi:hypothetical protein
MNFLQLVLALPTRELLLELAAAAGLHPIELETMTVADFQRRVAAVRDRACERDTVTCLPTAEDLDAFEEPDDALV